ncbi:MAG TPA: hypothetical protein VIC53_09820 [Wenzhouxiangella sp.]
MRTESDQELSFSGSWLLALVVFVVAQIALTALAKLALDPPGFWWVFGLTEAYAIWVMCFLVKPPNRLFFNGKRLLVCDQRGRKKACVDRPEGFGSPFFIGLRLGPCRSLGLFAWQMDATDFARLLRWMRQAPTSNHARKHK